MSLTQQTAHADTNCEKGSFVHSPEQNAGTYNSDIFSLQTSMNFGIMPLFNPYPSYSYDKVDSLLGSTVYGGWNDSFKVYNCYAYALGRGDDRFNIGDFSNHSLNSERYKGVYYLKNSIEELRDYTIQDLKVLGYECVYTAKNTYYEPFDAQTLICVRKSEIDFHFMKYINGDWLHKPGNSWILKYKGNPSAGADWYFEAAYPEKNGEPYFLRCNDYPYTGDIYFIMYANSHNYSTYTYCNNNEHEVKCKYCENVLQTAPHLFKPYKPDAKQCKHCGFILYDNGFGSIIAREEDNYETN